jgi:hypothetical protein
MDNGLFSKYKNLIVKNKELKTDLAAKIEKETGIKLTEKEITVKGRRVSFHVSSTKKTTLTLKEVERILKEEGYSLTER